MTASRRPQPERYAIENDRFVLYLGPVRALCTEAVALLIDTRLQRLITHGDPGSVRRELDEMREVLRISGAPRYDRDWLLVEGRPDLQWLNAALADPCSIGGLDLAFQRPAVERATDAARHLIDRVSRRAS